MKSSFDSYVSHEIIAFKQLNHELINSDPNFAKWLVEEYRPIAGEWQY